MLKNTISEGNSVTKYVGQNTKKTIMCGHRKIQYMLFLHPYVKEKQNQSIKLSTYQNTNII
jgi:hypothetical protein